MKMNVETIKSTKDYIFSNKQVLFRCIHQIDFLILRKMKNFLKELMAWFLFDPGYHLINKWANENKKFNTHLRRYL